MAIEYHQLRQIVLDHIRTYSKPGTSSEPEVDSTCRDAEKRAQKLDLAFDDDDYFRVLDILHEFYLERIIAPGLRKRNIMNKKMAWPNYRVTEYGREVLDQKDYVPHDPDGYLNQLKDEIPDIDLIIIRYLDEALGCFRAGHILAAAVMTGCAAEKAMLLLIEAFGQALEDPEEKKKYERNMQKHWMISRKYDNFWKFIQSKRKNLPDELTKDIDVILNSVFDLIRSTRNEAGHPTGTPVDRNVVRGNFEVLFPNYCRRVYALL